MSDTSKEWYKKPIVLIIAGVILVWLLFSDTGILGLLGFGSAGWWFPIIVGVLLTIVFIKKNNEKKRRKEKEKAREPQNTFWKNLGQSASEREKNINKLFEAKSASLTFGEAFYFNSWDGQANISSSLSFRISRNLAAMESREREFLKTALLLYNSEKLSENQFHYYMFAFINGNGKTSIEHWQYERNWEDFKNGPGVVKFYQEKIDGSVDSAINGLLSKIEGLGLITGEDNLKQIKAIKTRIQGEPIWLGEDEIEGTVFEGKGKYQLKLGPLEDTEAVLHYSGEGSLMTIAPPRAGKSQCLVIPNMLNWKGSAIVLDISGEIFNATSKWRSENVGPVFKFTPLEPSDSHCYNPLVFVREDPDYIWEDARLLADMMIVPSGASDPFWENSARDVLTAAIAHIAFNNDANERNMSKVLDIIYGIGWDEMIVSLKTNILVSSMRRAGHTLDEMERKQRDSVLKTAQSSLSAWQGERISKTTRQSDWNPIDLRDKGNMTIYICIKPNEIDSYISVLRVFIAQHVEILLDKLPERNTFAPVLFMLDEFPRLKNMPPIDKALNAGAKYGIRLWMFAQSYGQLKESYQNAEGMLGSCAIRTFMNLPLNDELTTKISDQLGYRSDKLGNEKEKWVEPLELAGPNYNDLILVFAAGTKPARVRKRFAYQDKELLERLN